MRYAVFTDIHANLEALKTVLAKIDELNEEEPIDQIWFLGDLVGYGPNPNECIELLRERTEVIIAGNHDWAAVGKLDLDDFSEPARVSAEWTAKELTEEHREFLRNLPERLEIGECTLVHGSPYGPLWEYLTSEALAERSFEHFESRFCLVGHTHIPVIFQQPYTFANGPTEPFSMFSETTSDEEETAAMATVLITSQKAETVEHALLETPQAQKVQEEEVSTSTHPGQESTDEMIPSHELATNHHEAPDEPEAEPADALTSPEGHAEEQEDGEEQEDDIEQQDTRPLTDDDLAESGENEAQGKTFAAYEITDKTTSENEIQNAEGRLNDEIEELLALLGLSQSMIQVTNEMSTPPEGLWTPEQRHRAIINPGGVGQPRDSDPRAAFMIYDSERRTFEFFRVAYPLEKTQEKIVQAGLPPYLAVRLAYGR